jgi:prepilin-type N-terminal cleavage/methylation domain-containing protein
MTDERGWSLIEMMIVLTVLAVVLAATLSLLDKTTELSPADEERAPALRDAQVGLHRITRDLRQAYELTTPATGASGDVVVAKVSIKSVDTQVTYDCSLASLTDPALRRCRRTAQPVAGGASKTDTVVDRLANTTPVFERTGEDFMKARLVVPARGERDDAAGHRITLDDGFYLRNVR